MVKNVLVVDDEKDVRDFMEKALSKSGYEVSLASDGEEALEMFRASSYHLVISDMNMPGMNGMELCKRIRHEKPTTIVFAMTGYISVFDMIKCREAGFEDYFPKPFDVVELLDSVEYAFVKMARWRRKQKI